MTSTKSNPTDVVVVDGSNIATEGRSTPSLVQLNDAVMAFREEFPDAVVTVVVDATFGHRIDKKESADFDAAVAHNELVAPPAGAIGRGDAFVLSIANKVGARILSNDSFQEFHGDYPWLFDEGRLIGGKPVPFVGWVFVERLPVKGPISRKSQRAARGGGGERERKSVRRTSSKAASLPMPVPSAPPPGARRPAAIATTSTEPVAPSAVATPAAGPAVNDVLPFLDFVEHHPIGSSVNGVVESYSSHGAYVSIGDLRGYVPLRLMSDPPPRSAREVMRVDDAVTLVVVSFAPARRSVDLAVPAMAPGAEVVPTPELEELAEAVSAPAKPARAARKSTARKRAATESVAAAVEEAAAEVVSAAEPPPAKRAAKKAASTKKQAATTKAAATKATKRPSTPKAASAPAKQAAPRKRAAKQVAPDAAQAGGTVDDGSSATADEPRKRAPRKRSPSSSASGGGVAASGGAA